jgi:hypothetical protein
MSETTPLSTPLVTPTPNEVVSIINNCETITLFDMGIRCNVERTPSTSTSTDGILSIVVTGGTSPYTVYWNGIRGNQRLIGVGQGSYPVTVVDYYGDYTASTVCNIIIPTATPTQTATPTPTPTPIVYPNLCFVSQEPNISYGPIQFIWNGNSSNFNGKPTWSGTYNSTPLTIRWVTQNQLSRWEIQGWNFTTGIPVSTNTTNIPISAWSMAGGQPATITMTTGTCPPYLPLRTSISKQDSTCPNRNNGSIIINAIDGVSGYTYSINGGSTYTTNNVFTNLPPNTYTVVVKDSATPTPNTTTSQIQVNIANPNPLLYTLTPYIINSYSTGTGNQTFEWGLNITPKLSSGQILSLNISQFTYNYEYGPGNGTFNNTYAVKKNGVSIPINTTTNFNQVTPRPFCPSTITQTTDTGLSVVTIGQGDIITGIITSNLLITNPQINAGCATKLESTSYVTGNVNKSPGPNQPIGFNDCDNFTMNNLSGLNNTLP